MPVASIRRSRTGRVPRALALTSAVMVAVDSSAVASSEAARELPLAPRSLGAENGTALSYSGSPPFPSWSDVKTALPVRCAPLPAARSCVTTALLVCEDGAEVLAPIVVCMMAGPISCAASDSEPPGADSRSGSVATISRGARKSVVGPSSPKAGALAGSAGISLRSSGPEDAAELVLPRAAP
jgi:hypothetical protein